MSEIQTNKDFRHSITVWFSKSLVFGHISVHEIQTFCLNFRHFCVYLKSERMCLDFRHLLYVVIILKPFKHALPQVET